MSILASLLIFEEKLLTFSFVDAIICEFVIYMLLTMLGYVPFIPNLRRGFNVKEDDLSMVAISMEFLLLSERRVLSKNSNE